jgi:HSP20 family molecular chaperone IbpA
MNATTLNPQDRLLTQLATIPACQRPMDGTDWFPPVDIVDDAEEYLFKVDLPEVNPENLQVFGDENDLVICGERASPWQDERKLLRVERPHGYFVRRFALPADADARQITTLFAQSVLEVRVRKVDTHIRPPAPAKAPPRLRLRSTQ